MLAKISRLRGLRKHGFLKRMERMKKGSDVINSRRKKGRKILCPASQRLKSKATFSSR